MVNARVTNWARMWRERGKWSRLLGLAAALAVEEGHADGFAVDPGKPAVAIGEAHRRQHQENPSAAIP